MKSLLPKNFTGPTLSPWSREHPILLCLLSTTLMLFLNGCSALNPTVTNTSSPQEASTAPPASSPATTASLWNEHGELARLYTDNRASRVGDIVTIRIVENATGAKSATTKTAKDSSMENTFAGSFKSFFDLPARALAFLSPSGSIKVTAKDNYNGNGATTRNDQLTASMTAIVTEVYPNGNLKIRGHREVVVNSERQTMELTGIVRPIDVDFRNTVPSTAVADAKISYTGFGVVDDKQHPGWLGRIMNWISPF
jgi:flagellar L-ring protein precursor FlgH